MSFELYALLTIIMFFLRETWVYPQAVVTFQIQPLFTSIIMGERVISSESSDLVMSPQGFFIFFVLS